MKNCFISYNHQDEAWAKWIDWTLRAEGYDTILQVYDFPVGSNFVANMHDALKQADCVLGVLTQAFLDSDWCKEEWTNAIDQLIPVRVADVQPDGLLKRRIYIDLYGLPEDAAREKLLAGMRGESRPTTKPPFPPTESKPAFPGVSPSTDSQAPYKMFMVFAMTVIAFIVVLAVVLANPKGNQGTNGTGGNSINIDGGGQHTIITGNGNTGDGNQSIHTGDATINNVSGNPIHGNVGGDVIHAENSTVIQDNGTQVINNGGTRIRNQFNNPTGPIITDPEGPITINMGNHLNDPH